MAYVVTLTGYRPSPRYDALPWTSARIEEAATETGTYAAIQTIALSPVDSDPTDPAERNFTSAAATLPQGWYRVVFLDAAAHEEGTDPVYSGGPVPGNLTTLAAVRAFMQKSDTDLAQDELIEDTIARASTAILNYAQREFAPTQTALARKFSYTGGGVLYFGSYDLRTATLVQIDTDVTGLTLTAATDYKLQPVQPRDGIYTSMLIFTQDASDWRPREVTITGNWGFATVPDDVEEACILTVVDRLKRDVSGYTQAFDNDDPATIIRPISIPMAARRALDHYRRPMVA